MKRMWNVVRIVNKLLPAVTCMLALFASTRIQAAPVDGVKAVQFAENWLHSADKPLETDITNETILNDFLPVEHEGLTLAWVIPLDPKGFIVIAGDDRANPVVMVSHSGSFDNAPENPLRKFLVANLLNLYKGLEKAAPDNRTRGSEIPAAVAENKATWDKYLKPQTRGMGSSSVTEVWVKPLIQSKWGQADGIYNYYTPLIKERSYSFDEPGNEDNAVCGCVATAMAQVLRYFQWPQKPVGVIKGSAVIDYADQSKEPKNITISPYLIGGDGNGGAYNWGVMDLIPSSNSSLKTFQQIGALCFDAGLSVGMNYADNESAASTSPQAYKTFFKYAGAGSGNSFNAARANLDARRPVCVSIADITASLGLSSSGHAIVCDGYGRMDGRWYYHMNFGWNGGCDLWYNFEEHFFANNYWDMNISFSAVNIYRQKLQKNEDAVSGKILSGRVVDANGNPVSGVKVSIRKQGEAATWQTMLAWNDPKNPLQTPIYKDWDMAGNGNGVWEDSELPGADKYRNTTDAMGIWAVDKVQNGNYEIVLEKDGLNFAGVKTVNVTDNKWGINFIASPMENLALLNWWKDASNNVYLVFNRNLGNAVLDLSAIKIGGTSLTGKVAHVSASSNIVVIEGVTASGNLTMTDGALYIDVDGQTSIDQPGMNDMPVVNVATPVSTGMAPGTASEIKVSSIARTGSINTKDNELQFQVTGSGLGDIKLSDFKVRVLSSEPGTVTLKKAVFPPKASLLSWDPATGIAVVSAKNGDGYILLDYVPETGTPFISGDWYYFDDCGPVIWKAELAADNTYVNVYWNEPVKGLNGVNVTENDLNILLNTNGGTVTKAQIKAGGVSYIDDSTLKVMVDYTPDMEATAEKSKVTSFPSTELLDEERLAEYKVPAGTETIQVVPRENSVFDNLANKASTGNTTGALLLRENNRPRVISATVGYDNMSLQIVFNKRISGSKYHLEGYDIDASMLPMLIDEDFEAWRYISEKNVKVTVVYDDSSSEDLKLENTDEYQSVIALKGGSVITVDFMVDHTLDNIDKLYMYGAKKPVSLKVTLTDIKDIEDNALVDNEFTIPLHPGYEPGKVSLPPPMFTNQQGSYTFIKSSNVTIKKESELKQTNGHGDAAFGYGSPGMPYFINYGVWYRDLDGDGRVDAVDLNFHNPDSLSRKCTLKVGDSAKDNFSVYVQVFDPDDDVTAPEDDDIKWNLFPKWNQYPLNGLNLGVYSENTPVSDEALRNPDNFVSTQWIQVDVTSLEVLDKRDELYTTLRVKFDQERIPAKTNGDRYVMVTYTAPQKIDSELHNKNSTYDGRMVAGSTVPATNEITEEFASFKDDDETAGIYWHRPYDLPRTEENGHYGSMDSYYICDSFGPVMCWDGAEAVPVTATAWRTTPYPKLGEEGFEEYEYLDVRFTEPIAYAGDDAMSDCGADMGELLSAEGVIHGVWGAELLDKYTARFKIRSGKKDLDFTFMGDLFERSGGIIEHFPSIDTPIRELKLFKVRPIGVKMLDSRYCVTSQNDNVAMLEVDADGAQIENFFHEASIIFPLSVKQVELKSLEQGGDWRAATANWFEGETNLGSAAKTVLHNVAEDARRVFTYSIKSNALSTNIRPGSSVYGYISSITPANDTFAEYEYYEEDIDGNSLVKYYSQPDGLNYAPNSMDRGMGYATASTPLRGVISGPVYNMVKVSPLPSEVSEIVSSGVVVPVLGIDAAGSDYTLSAVTVRVIDTSYGQFDPEIDLEPLADGQSSGLLLLRADNSVVMMANDGVEWSEWRFTVEGLPYREVILRPLAAETLPANAGEKKSFDYYVAVRTSENYNLGDSFIVEIPDDGITIGTYSTVATVTPSWGTPDGTVGFPFTDHRYYDLNNDGRWSEGEPILSAEDLMYPTPLYDGGNPYFTVCQTEITSDTGINPRRLYYAKKNGATNPESSPYISIGNMDKINAWAKLDLDILFIHEERVLDIKGSTYDLSYNVSYAPGDDIWYDIGGTPGVYDQGIDIPLFGNASMFPLPWQVAQSGAKSAHQYKVATPASVKSVTDGFIEAPSNGPVAMLGLDMHDSGKGFGPRYILNNSILVESASKNIPGGEYTVAYRNTGSQKTIKWNNGPEVTINPVNGSRAIVADGNGTFIVVCTADAANLPEADAAVSITVSEDADRDIQQPSAITGVRVLGVGRGNVAGQSFMLRRSGTSLSWNGGAYVDVADGGFFALNGDGEDYLLVQVTKVGGAASEELAVYTADGRNITPFMNISGLEIMAVSDMVPQGFYNFSYDGAGALSWGSGSPANVASSEFTIVYGDGTGTMYGDGRDVSWPLNYVVVRRTGAALPASACTDSLFINQSRLLKVKVTISDVSGFTATHLKPMSTDGNSGISLWWDVNGDGKFSSNDMPVRLLEPPVLEGSGKTMTAVLTPDPQWLTAWLTCPQDSSIIARGANFFVCVNTTSDMSYGDKFSVSAEFYEPAGDESASGELIYAKGNTGNVTCISITNTVFSKLTKPGQTLDAGTVTGLASIDNFVGSSIGKSVYMTAVKVRIHRAAGAAFTPEEVFASMYEGSATERGIILYADTNGNGRFDAGTDTAIPCAISVIADEVAGVWEYVLHPEDDGGLSSVTGTDDNMPDHFVAVRLSKNLPYGISFYATMDKEAVTYNTGAGNAAASMKTDTLSSTINSKYADLLDSSMVTSTTGLVINRIGSAVESGYHKVSLSYNPATGKYFLNWNGNTVEIDITKSGTYVLGTGEESIEVTFNPLKFFREDTLVYSATGRPDADIPENAPLISIAGQGLTYFDANGNGRYDGPKVTVTFDEISGKNIVALEKGETIAFGGTVIYGDDAAATVEFDAASALSFYDADGNGIYTSGESIFVDTDRVYSLPWMSLLVDSDNYITPGQGGAAAGISGTTELADAAGVSIGEGEDAVPGIYLYYIDMLEDGRGYVYGEDVIVSRTVDAQGLMAALVFGSNDKVVFHKAYDPENPEAYVEPSAGMALKQFKSEDYLRFRQGGSSEEAYEQGEAIFLSNTDTFKQVDFSWSFRVDMERRIRWYNANYPAPYNQEINAVTAVAGLDIANSGASDVLLTKLVVRFANVSNFSMSDLRPLTAGIDSGVQLWRDLDGNGIFNPFVDKLVGLATAPSTSFNGDMTTVIFTPVSGNEISNSDVDGLYDFFVAVQPSEISNSKAAVDSGDQFRVIIENSDVVLNKTLNKTVSLNSGVITIDSKQPELLSAVTSDTDKDGYLEKLVLTFGEKLRPGMLDDLSIWKLRDAMDFNKAFTVEKAELSEDYMTVTLTFSGHDYGTTTGPVALIVEYNANGALLDWAGNAVDFRIDTTTGLEGVAYANNYTVSGDNAAPLILHSGIKLFSPNYVKAEAAGPVSGFFFRDRNANGVYDLGEDIWLGSATYSDPSTRIWNGGTAWTTEAGYAAGVSLDNVLFYCDANDNGQWDRGEFLWISTAEPAIGVVPEFDGAADIVIAQNRTEEIQVLDTDADGILDAFRVEFSENVNDSTMTGYEAAKDFFPASAWTLSGRANLMAWRRGLNGAYSDNQNNNVLYFTFDKSAEPDSGSIPGLTVSSGEQLKDAAGNLLNDGAAYGNNALVLADNAGPVAVSAASSGRVDPAGVLKAGTKLTFTFSEKLVNYYEKSGVDMLSDFQISKNGTYVGFDTILGVSDTVEFDGDSAITVTFAEDNSGWAASGVMFKVAKNLSDTVFGDAAGNNLVEVTDIPVADIESSVATVFVSPADGEFLERFADAGSSSLAVQIQFGDNDPSLVTEWSLELTQGDVTIDTISGMDPAGLDNFTTVNLVSDFNGWVIAGQEEYKLTLTLVIGGEEKVFTSTFYAGIAGSEIVVPDSVFDGLVAGQDVDEVLVSDGVLSANWIDFAAASGLPAAAKYRLIFREIESSSEVQSIDNITGLSYELNNVTLIEGKHYVAEVTAFTSNDVILASAASNGVEAVSQLMDKIAPVMTYVKHVDENGIEIPVTSSTDTLYGMWSASDNKGVTGYMYRIITGQGAASSWSADAGTLESARIFFGQATAADGSLMVIGGFDGDNALSTVENYNAATRIWSTAKTGMNAPRYNFGFAEDADYVVVAGGMSNTGILSSVEVYSKNDGEWTVMPVVLASGRMGCQVVSVGGGKFWVAGGKDSAGLYCDAIEEIDVAAGTVTVLPVKLSVARNNAVAVLQRLPGGNRVLVIGGDTGSASSKLVDAITVDTLEITSFELDVPRRSGFAVVPVPVNGNTADDIWVMGGFTENTSTLTNSVEIIKSGIVKAAAEPMDKARAQFQAIWIDSYETVLLTGGVNDESGSLAGHATFETYTSDGVHQDSGSLSAVHGYYRHGMAVAGTGEHQRIVVFTGMANGAYSRTSESRKLIEILKDWTSVSTGEVTVTGLELADGGRYVFQVKACDEAGNWSSIMSSNGIAVDTDVVSATVFSAQLPTGIIETAARDYVFTVGGENIAKYDYQLDGAAKVTDVPVSTPITKNGLDLGAHTLKVWGKYTGGKTQVVPVTIAWTITEPVAVIESGLPAEGATSTAVTYYVKISGAGITSYVWSLEKDSVTVKDWSAKTSVENTINLSPALEAGCEYTLKVKGYAGDIEGAEVSRTWNISGASLNLTFVPELTVPSAHGTFAVSVEATVAGIDGYKYALKDKDAVIVKESESVQSLANVISLNITNPGIYTLEVYGHHSDDTFETVPVSRTINFAKAEFGTFTPENKISPVTKYQVEVNLNGLASFKYQLDDYAQETGTGTVINLESLTTGVHTLKIWGVDALDAVNAEAEEVTIQVTSELPIGEILNPQLSVDAATAPAGDDINVTLKFNNVLMSDPVEADFTVENGSIKSIVKDALNEKNYEVLVTPAPLSGVNQKYVSVTLNSGTVYSKENGNSNAASNTVKVLVYNEAVLAMKLEAEGLTDGQIAAGAQFSLKVLAAADVPFLGGDVKLYYNDTKFQPVLTGTPEEQAAAVIDEKYQLKAEVETGVDADGTFIRLQGSSAAIAASNEAYLFAVLKFVAVGTTAAADDTDFFLKPGNNGLLLKEFGLLAKDEPAVSYGKLAVAVVFEKAVLTLSITGEPMVEADDTMISIELDREIEADLEVVFSIDSRSVTTIIAAGDTVRLVQETLADDDLLITGDRTVDITITSVSEPGLVEFSTDPTTVKILDKEIPALAFKVVADSQDPETGVYYINEGNTFKVLPDSTVLTGVPNVSFTLDIQGMELYNDYTYEQLPVVKTSGTQIDEACAIIRTYADGAMEDWTVTVQVTGMTVDGVAPSNFTKSEIFTIKVINQDVLPGDFTGDSKVDDYDLMDFLTYYGLNSTDVDYNAAYDFDGNGVVDFYDLLYLLSCYTDEETSGSDAGTRAGETITVTLAERDGKTIVNPGEVINVEIYVSSNVADGVTGLSADVTYDVNTFGFNGTFNAADVVNTEAFNFIMSDMPGGSLTTAGISELRGSHIKAGEVPAPAKSGEDPVLFATIPLLVKAGASGNFQVALNLINATAYTGYNSNPNVVNAKPLAIADISPLNITVVSGFAIPEFKLAFETEYSDATRGSSKELIIGMKNGASDEYAIADGDSLAFETPGMYSASFASGNNQLKWDIRDTADSAEWTGTVKLPAGKALKLDWACNLEAENGGFSMPSYFDFTLTPENGQPVNMKTAQEKNIKFVNSENTEKTFTFSVKAVKSSGFAFMTYELGAGWNLIGIPFVLDAASTDSLKEFTNMAYDSENSVYVNNVDTFEAGIAYWIYSETEQVITLTGTVSAGTETVLAEGWNLVTPLLGCSNPENAADGTDIQTVWYWEEDGYKWLLPADKPVHGKGYWLNTARAKAIWSVD